MKSNASGIAARIYEHLAGSGLANDLDTDDLYREAHGITEDQDTDLDDVERWAIETAQAEGMRRTGHDAK